ncbi:MAG: CBS domain-containing protein [Proteobacteria bacterium]|nr:CBS domain-containing protein [Pseudomonadota bacterium]
MKVIVGHSNMDLDVFGSMALIKYIYPDYRLVQSQLIHPAARNLYNLYQNRFDFITSKELKNESIERIVVVDTRSKGRVDEYFKRINGFSGQIEVFDHHPSDENDIEDAVIHSGDYGANTTLIGLELIKRGIAIEPEDATIALTGIYSDTGNFQHENVADEDFHVASFLLKNDASIKLVRKFLETLKDRHQIVLFHDILNRLTYKEISGHFLILAYIEIEDQAGGLAAVIEKIFEVERSDAIFCVFHFKKNNNSLIIARSGKDTIKLNQILKKFGGGGHERAASALVKDTSGMMVFATLEEHLKMELRPAVKAEDIMNTKVDVIKDGMSMMEASILLEKVNHTGAPVLTSRKELVGFMTLRDIMKARKGNQMNASVKGYMSMNVVTATKDITIRDVENLLYQNNIGHLPIVQGKALVGMVTRSDYLKFMEDGKVTGVEENGKVAGVTEDAAG